MSKLKLTKAIAFGALLLPATMLAGCGGNARVSGTYSDPNQIMSVRFQGDRAYWSVDAGLGSTTKVLKYAVHGNRIILKSPQGNVVLTLNKEGSIEGPAGETLVKR